MKKVVIIPGFCQTTLGTVRCLARKDVESWLIGPKDSKGPAYYSNIPQKKIVLNDSGNLIDCLETLGKRFPSKPALLLTADAHVVEVANNLDIIKKYYRCILPPLELVDLLMDKVKFSTLAMKNGYKIPKTIFISDREKLDHIEQYFTFPFVLKPYLLHSRKINSSSELREYLRTFSYINFKSMIIQEWIPGEDDHLYFCFLFFDEERKIRAKFMARKIRQYPLEYGTTSFCVSTHNQNLMKRSIKIFEDLDYCGFCSIEYKYHKKMNEYFIMEPTVGRFNQQIALTRVAGVNFPLAMLKYLYGERVKSAEQLNKKYWIYETDDFLSLIKSGGLASYYKCLRQAHSKVLFSKTDPLPFFGGIYDMVVRKVKKTVKRELS